MITRLRALALLTWVSTVAGCTGTPTTAWQGSVTDSAGIQLVRNPDTGIWGPDDDWTLTEVLRIGAAEGEPEYQFGQILAAGSIALASDGRIVVLDAQGQHLKVFTADGAYERTIGRPGAGPGEIGIATQSSMLMAPGDTILMVDLGNQRVNLYVMDGTFVRSFPIDLAVGFPFRWELTDDGRVVAQLRRLDFAGAAVPADSMDVISVRRLDGTAGDTLMRVPSGKTVQFSGGLPEWNLFVPEPLWALWGERVLYAVNDNYRIGVYRSGGQLERVIEKPFTRAPVTEADQAPLKRALRKAILDQGAPAQVATQLVDTRLHFAPHYPAFAQMLEGPNRTILVQLVRPLSDLSDEERESYDFTSGATGSPRWDVFDDQGRYLGALLMPARFQPVEFRGNEIYGVQWDELDVQYVVKLVVGTTTG
jgi:hypothetical protein